MRSALVNFGSKYYMLMWVNVTQRRLGEGIHKLRTQAHSQARTPPEPTLC